MTSTTLLRGLCVAFGVATAVTTLAQCGKRVDDAGVYETTVAVEPVGPVAGDDDGAGLVGQPVGTARGDAAARGDLQTRATPNSGATAATTSDHASSAEVAGGATPATDAAAIVARHTGGVIMESMPK